MAKICNKCGRAHHSSEKDCDKNWGEEVKWRKDLDEEVAVHRKTCRGCPDPERHVLNLREIEKKHPDISVAAFLKGA